MTHTVSRLRILTLFRALAIQAGVLQPDGRANPDAGIIQGKVGSEAAAVLEQCKDEIAKGPAFTVFCRESNGKGTIYISAVHAHHPHAAARAVLKECSFTWGMDTSSIDVIGIIEGDANVLEWNDSPNEGGLDVDRGCARLDTEAPAPPAAANDPELAPMTRLVIQEGGSSGEHHLAALAGEAEAEAFRDSCSQAGYRTSPPVRLSGPLAQQFEQDPNLVVLLTDVVNATRLISFPAQPEASTAARARR